METYTHACIKCGNQYKDNDPDAYYCDQCNEQRKLIAKEVDMKFAHRPKKEPKSDLQMFDEARQGGRFVHSKKIGL